MKNFKFQYLPQQNRDGSGTLNAVFYDYKNTKHSTFTTESVFPADVKKCALWSVMVVLKEYVHGTIEWRKKAFEFYEVPSIKIKNVTDLLPQFDKSESWQDFITSYDELHGALLHISPKLGNTAYDAFTKRLNLVENSILEASKGFEVLYEYQLNFEPVAHASGLPF